MNIEGTNIPKATHKLYAIFDKIRGKPKEEFGFRFWDVVVLTTADVDQKVAYEKQLDQKMKNGDLPKGIDYLVFSDPPGTKVGCGGSTLEVISQLDVLYGPRLDQLFVLLINAGGQSQRLPSSSVLGKIFMALPVGNPMFTLLELKLACYIPFLEKMRPGFFHAASDTIEVFDLGDDAEWTFEKPGFTALAHPSSLTIGSTHGVFVLDKGHQTGRKMAEMRTCLEVLQKPSIKKMEDRNAVITYKQDPKLNRTPPLETDWRYVYTDSCFYFDHEVSRKLLKFYREDGPLECEVDAYGDFLQALGSQASSEYTKDVKNVSKIEPKLIETREKIFHVLRGTPLNILALNASKFYHVGTMKEYTFHFCNDNVLATEVGFKRQTFNRFHSSASVTKRARRDNDIMGCVMHSNLTSSSTVGMDAIVEFCDFSVDIVVAEKSILSNCVFLNLNGDSNDPIKIPAYTFLHQIPVKLENNSGYVTLVLNVTDDIKKKVNRADIGKLKYCDTPLSKVYKLLGLDSQEDLFDHDDGVTAGYSLWNAKIFPWVNSMDESFALALKIISTIQEGSTDHDLLDHRRLSMSDVLVMKDVHAMVEYRNRLYHKIRNYHD